MCGIIGVVSWKNPPTSGDIRPLMRSISHRGPDGWGIWTEGPASLGHHRLSIIDLDPRSGQPMTDESGRFVIVFNGELYNYRELRAELLQRDVRFKTESDTEVLLQCYRVYGSDAFDRLEGMFAFGLWDRLESKLILARDRAGEKPLYYRRLPCGGIAFASELTAVPTPEAVAPATAPNPSSLLHYCRFGYMPSKHSILAGIAKLEPAHSLEVSNRQFGHPQRYWNVRQFFYSKRKFANLADAADELRCLLDVAVKRQNVADVDIGVFLSGGLDSSSIAASVASIPSNKKKHAFSLGFNVDSYDETDSARMVAEHLGLHHELHRMPPVLQDELIAIAQTQDEPLADTSYFPTSQLSRFARSKVKVVMGGDGADELFSGYSTYTADWLSSLVPSSSALWDLTLAALNVLPHSREKVSFDFKLRQFAQAVTTDWPSRHPLWRQFIQLESAIALIHPDLRQSAAENFIDPASLALDMQDAHRADQAMYIDFCTWLPDDILTKVDRASMTYGLEVRAPFLDRSVVEFAAALPPSYRRSLFSGKRVLRRAQDRRLPSRILNRGKQGFNAPMAIWLSDQSPRIREVFETPLKDDPFDQCRVQTYWHEHTNKRRDHHLILMAVLIYRIWLSSQRDRK